MEMLAALKRELIQLEKSHGIDIVLVSECGSRSWGYAEKNSDYDIRFVYVQLPWKMDVSDTSRDVHVRLESGGYNFDMQGTEMRRHFGKIARSCPNTVRTLLGGTFIAGALIQMESTRTLMEYINQKGYVEAYLSLSHNLLNMKSRTPFAKQLMVAMHHLLVIEQALTKPLIECKFNVVDLSVNDKTELGHIEEIKAYYNFLRVALSAEDNQPFQEALKELHGKLVKFKASLTSRVEEIFEGFTKPNLDVANAAYRQAALWHFEESRPTNPKSIGGQCWAARFLHRTVIEEDDGYEKVSH